MQPRNRRKSATIPSMLPADIPSHELPLWMRRALRGTDWGAVLAALIGLLACWQLLVQDAIAPASALERYHFRIADTAAALRDGVLFTRWAPAAFGGYGAPIPHFAPPFPTYTASLLVVTLTDTPAVAVRIVQAASIIIAAWAMYRLISRTLGARAGVIGAATYVFTPAIGVAIPYTIGSLDLTVGMALLPLLFLSTAGDQAEPRPVPIILCCAVFLLTAPVLALMSMALTLVIHFALRPSARNIARLVGLYMLGIMLAAFHLVPAALEAGGVRWLPPERSYPFPTFIGLFAPAAFDDPASLFPNPALQIGLLPPALLLTGLVVDWHTRHHKRALVLAVCAVFFSAGALLLRSPEMLILAAFSFASAGASSAHFMHRSKHWPTLLLMVILLAGTPQWFTLRAGLPSQPADTAAQVQYELNGYGIATISPYESAPTTLSPTTALDRALATSFISGQPDKIGGVDTASPLQAAHIAHTARGDRFRVRVFAPDRLRILTAYFPGWQALYNETPIPIERDPASGLITVQLDSVGTGELVLRFGTTPLRVVAALLSLIGFVLMLLAAYQDLRQPYPLFEEQTLLSKPETRNIGRVLASCFLIILFIGLPSPPRPGTATNDRHPLNASTQTGLQLLGYRVRPSTETVEIDTFWSVSRPQNNRLLVEIRLLDSSSAIIASSTVHTPASYPIERWPVGRYVIDTVRLPRPSQPHTNGPVSLEIGVIRCDGDCARTTPVPLLVSSGAPLTTVTLPLSP